MIIDAEKLVVGRLASFVAKQALMGETVEIVNAEKAVIIGSKTDILAKYKQRRARGSPHFGPFFPHAPERILKRSIRGMLPYKITRGRDALERVKCYKGVPARFKDKELISPEHVRISQEKMKFISLQRLSELL